MNYNLNISEDAALALFHSQVMVTKAEVLNNVDWQIDAYKSEIKDALDADGVLLRAILGLLKEFRSKIALSPVFDAPADWWAFSFEIASTAITLNLEHYAKVEFDGDEIADTQVDASFPLIQVKAKLLTVEEYAEQYGVLPVTVRQWIRRGKLRTAVKAGYIWMIPELTTLPTRGYSTAEYEWDRKGAYFPEGYEYLSGYSHAELTQDTEDRNLYHAYLSGGKKDTVMDLTIKEREALELVLITQPFVTYLSDSFGVFA